MKRSLPFLLALLAACRPAGGGETPAPRGTVPSGDVPHFDARAAHALIATQLAFGPRAPGSPGHAAQLAWMDERLRALADTVQLQPFTHVTVRGDTLHLTNVLARFRPDHPDRILLVAHWDTRPTADLDDDPARRTEPIPGANDGGSGTAVLLQLADVLSRHSPPLGVDLLFVDGEDYAPGEMYLGARHFAANLPAGYAPRFGIVVDMVADEDPVFPMEAVSREHAPDVVDRVWRLAEQLGYAVIFRRIDGSPVSDDHVPLNDAGIPTIDIIDMEYGPGARYWHTHQDTFEHTAQRGLEAVGRVLTELIFTGA